MIYTNRLSFLLLTVLILSFFSSCHQDQPTQDFSLIFGGAVPDSLVKFAKPKPDKKTLDNYLSRDKSGELTVGIIDTGADYTHDDLKDRMEYQFDSDGNLKNIGHDVLGNSFFAHPRFFDATLFSFGASAIDDHGRIINPPADPIALLVEFNDLFMSKVADKLSLANQKKLPSNLTREEKDDYKSLHHTFFLTQINKNSFSLFSYLYLNSLLIQLKQSGNFEEMKMATSFLSLSPSSKEKFLEKIRTKDLDILMNEINRDETVSLFKIIKKMKNPDYPSELLSYSFYRKYFLKDWRLSSSLPLPDFGGDDEEASNTISALFMSKGFFPFMKILDSAYMEMEDEKSFNDAIRPYKKYRSLQTVWNSEDEQEKDHKKIVDNTELVFELYQKWSTKRNLYADKDPLYNISRKICDTLSEEEYEKVMSTEKVKDDISKDIIKKYVRKYVHRIHNIAQMRETKDRFEHDAPFIHQMSTNEKLYKESYKPLIIKYLEKRNLGQFICHEDEIIRSEMGEKYRQYNEVIFNEYAADGVGESHGTHVSGIVAKQDPKIRIFPVRVINSPHLTPPQIKKQQLAQFLNSFHSWVKSNPYVLRYLKDKYPREIKEDCNAKELTDLFKAELVTDHELKSTTIFNLTFVTHIIEAVKVIGQQKIKVANISMGESSDLMVLPPSEDGAYYLKQIASYIFHEFFKYQVGNAILNYAPNTIFVAASGNDGAWFDGVSKSNIPCHLGNPQFERYRKAAEPEILNNKIENIVCVGSINKNREISSFANTPLKTYEMFVYAEGESILAPIIRYDCQGVSEIQNSRTRNKTISYTDFEDPEMILSQEIFMRDFLKEGSYPVEEKKKLSELLQKPTEIVTAGEKSSTYDKIPPNYFSSKMGSYKRAVGLYGDLINASLTQSCVVDNYFYARLTGTSMASPLAAGKIASYLIEKMNRLHIVNQEDIYDDKNFGPHLIIQEIKRNLPSLSCDEHSKCFRWDDHNRYRNYPLDGFLTL